MSRALLVVDVQLTFCEGGELAVSGGNQVAHRISRFLATHASNYQLVISSQDWHIDPGRHFSDQPDFIDTWPPHGLAESTNAQLHPVLADFPFAYQVRKGQYEAAYSAFEGKTETDESLAQLLAQAQITELDLVGIALSHCVKDSALDAIRLGFQTRIFTDLTVPVSPDSGQAAQNELLAAGVKLITSTQFFGY